MRQWVSVINKEPFQATTSYSIVKKNQKYVLFEENGDFGFLMDTGEKIFELSDGEKINNFWNEKIIGIYHELPPEEFFYLDKIQITKTQNKPCNCKFDDLLNFGCKCGGS